MKSFTAFQSKRSCGSLKIAALILHGSVRPRLTRSSKSKRKLGSK